MKYFFAIFYIQVFSIFFVSSLFGRNGSTILVSNLNNKYPLKGYLLFYPETHFNKDIYQIVQFYKADKFKEVNYFENTATITDILATGWFAISIQNNTVDTKNLILKVIGPPIYSPEIYISDQLGFNFLLKPEDILSENSKSFLNKNFIYSIDLEPYSKKLIFVHVLDISLNIFFPSNLLERKKYDKDNLKETSIIGVYQGILIFILIFILFVFFTTKDKIYIYYFFY